MSRPAYDSRFSPSRHHPSPLMPRSPNLYPSPESSSHSGHSSAAPSRKMSRMNGGVSLLSIQLMAARSESITASQVASPSVPALTAALSAAAISTRACAPVSAVATAKATQRSLSVAGPDPSHLRGGVDRNSHPSAESAATTTTTTTTRDDDEAQTMKELQKMIKKIRRAKKQKQRESTHTENDQERSAHSRTEKRKSHSPRTTDVLTDRQTSTPPHTPPSLSQSARQETSHNGHPSSQPASSNIRTDFAAAFAGSGIPSGPYASHLRSGIASGLASGATTVGPPSLQTSPQRRASPAAFTQSGPVGSPIGQLSVNISEGSGLIPSLDPYVVCQFQWSEYISEGPKKRSGGVPVNRAGPGGLQHRAIPMQSRQSSSNGVSARGNGQDSKIVNPCWDHKATFDVVGEHCEIMVSVYDRSNNEAFLGQVRIASTLNAFLSPQEAWHQLQPRDHEKNEFTPTGRIKLRIAFHKTAKKQVGPEDFTIRKLIGKGTFGQVFLVRKIDTGRIYAMKVLSKKVIVQKKEIAHTLGERNILVRTTMTDSPFIVGLKFSFQTPTDLYLVTDYMSGGELFRRLQLDGRFSEERTKFYIAEIILALQHLHDHDIVYRDLKPENILLDANGHIALCDFGLSKANLHDNATTNTFCGTTEYLAPEVLLDEKGYTKMVDFWSLGVLVFEMCCGWSPFYADDTQQMYRNIAFGKVRFPRDALSPDGRNFVKGLLNRNPKHRLGATRDAAELMDHPFFADIDWDSLAKKNVVPPFKPSVESEMDVSNFDPEFTNALNDVAGSLNVRAAVIAAGINPGETPLSPTVQANFQGFTFVDESALEQQFGPRSVRSMAGSHTNEPFHHPMSFGDSNENNGGRSRQHDRMDSDWEKNFSSENRMSGVMLHHAYDDVFNSRFEM